MQGSLITIGLRSLAYSAINCVTNAPLSSAEVFTVLLIDYEAWVCDLNPRDINGLPGALSFILCGQTVFSLAVNPGQTGMGLTGRAMVGVSNFQLG